MTFLAQNARRVIESSPVDYIKAATLRGSLYQADDASGAISSVVTQFPIDHTEPLKALSHIKTNKGWSLGALLEGHEFFLISPMRSAEV